VGQFQVFENPSEISRGIFPYVVVLQSHLLAASHTTVVAPIMLQDGRSAFTEISLAVPFAGAEHIVLIGELGAVETRLLRKPLGDLQAYEDQIRRALDRLFTGF
jgi:toxin CcdB